MGRWSQDQPIRNALLTQIHPCPSSSFVSHCPLSSHVLQLHSTGTQARSLPKKRVCRAVPKKHPLFGLRLLLLSVSTSAKCEHYLTCGFLQSSLIYILGYISFFQRDFLVALIFFRISSQFLVYQMSLFSHTHHTFVLCTFFINSEDFSVGGKEVVIYLKT